MHNAHCTIKLGVRCTFFYSIKSHNGYILHVLKLHKLLKIIEHTIAFHYLALIC